jgi:OOP family OmpA-OmpF porin
MRTLGRALGTLALLVLWEADARAKECANPLVDTCINSDLYWPNPGPSRFARISGTQTVGRGEIGFGLVATYLSRPVLLHVASPGPSGTDAYVVDNQVNGNFLFAYGVTERLQLDLALPVTFVQSGAGTSPVTGGRGLRDTAVRDLRFGFAYAIIPPERVAVSKEPFSLTARFAVSAPNGDNSDFAGERTAVFVPDLAAEYRVSRVFFGAELGARIRPVVEFAGARVGTQLVTGLAAGAEIFDRERLWVTLEAQALPNFAEQHETKQSAFGISSTPNGKSITPAEWMLAAHSAPVLAGDLAFMIGGGGPIPIGPEAITVPRFRFVLGVTYAPLDRDSDSDGIPDKTDLCPTRAGPRGGQSPGCPQESQP